MENDAVVVTEPSISDLRGMLSTPAVVPAAPAAAGEPAAKTEPASEPATQDTKESDRGADGKFKAKEDKPEPTDDTPLPVNVQKRIDKAVKAQREAERRAQELEARLGGNQESRPANQNAPAAAEPKALTPPKIEDFSTYEDYTRAIAQYEIQTEVKKQQDQAVKSAAETAQRQRHQNFDAAEVEARAKHADYDEVTQAIEWPKTAAMGPIADYLLDTKNTTLMYQLGKQPAELARIAALPPVQAIAALGKFEATLTQPEPAAQPAKRALPKPPANVGGSASAKAEDLNDPDIDMATFKRLYRSSLNAR